MLADFTCDDVTIRRPRDVPVAWTWEFTDDDSGSALPITDTTVVEVRDERSPSSTLRATSGTPPLGALALTLTFPSTGTVEVTSASDWTADAGTYFHEMHVTVDGHRIVVAGPFVIAEGGVS